MDTIKIKVKSDKNDRLDHFIALNIDKLSRSHAKRLIKDGLIQVNNKKTKSSYNVQNGDNIEVNIPRTEKIEIIPEDIAIDIIYEDDDIAIVNKPQDMVVYPATGNNKGTLANSLLFNFSSLSTISGDIRPGIVHRLDKDTSGLIIIAKNDKSHIKLSRDLKNKDIKRIYRALVHGNMESDNGTINAPIGRNPLNRTKMSVTKKNNRNAITNYSVIDRYEGFTLVELTLETGRTHQIRVHMSHINHPVVGDLVYARRKNRFGIEKQMLHAYKIGLNHPTSGEYIEFIEDVPVYFKEILIKLENERK